MWEGQLQTDPHPLLLPLNPLCSSNNVLSSNHGEGPEKEIQNDNDSPACTPTWTWNSSLFMPRTDKTKTQGSAITETAVPTHTHTHTHTRATPPSPPSLYPQSSPPSSSPNPASHLAPNKTKRRDPRACSFSFLSLFGGSPHQPARSFTVTLSLEPASSPSLTHTCSHPLPRTLTIHMHIS